MFLHLLKKKTKNGEKLKSIRKKAKRIRVQALKLLPLGEKRSFSKAVISKGVLILHGRP